MRSQSGARFSSQNIHGAEVCHRDDRDDPQGQDTGVQA